MVGVLIGFAIIVAVIAVGYLIGRLDLLGDQAGYMVETLDAEGDPADDQYWTGDGRNVIDWDNLETQAAGIAYQNVWTGGKSHAIVSLGGHPLAEFTVGDLTDEQQQLWHLQFGTPPA